MYVVRIVGLLVLLRMGELNGSRKRVLSTTSMKPRRSLEDLSVLQALLTNSNALREDEMLQRA